LKLLREPLENRKGILYIDGVSATDLLKYDTPLYVISETRIRNNFRHVREALSQNYKKIRIYYACKANTNLSVLKILESEGAYIDAVSPGEVFLALKAGFSADRILYTGTSVRDDELHNLAKAGISVNVDSASQLRRILEQGKHEFLSFRINPEIGAGHHDHCITAGKNAKFGIWEQQAANAYAAAKKAGVKRFGIHMHIGSGILNIEPFALALDKLLSVAKMVHDHAGVDFEFIDMGGGLGVPYRPEEPDLDLACFSDILLSLFKKRIAEYGLGEPAFCVEPGRYLVADASVLLTAVNTVKETPFKKYIGVDAGFNTLVRPTMYGSYHHILVANKLNEPENEVYDVAGPICESGDLLAKERKLPKINEGDVLAVLNAGAYGFAMSSQYNSRPRAAEVLVKKGKIAVVRGREKNGDLARNQKCAEWLN
jgi:diaminopimelate decarboxylase